MAWYDWSICHCLLFIHVYAEVRTLLRKQPRFCLGVGREDI